MPTSGLAAVRSIAIWVNVFIPFDLSGSTVRVRRGPHAGKSALDIGSALLLTDQRAFSRNPDALSRMHSYVRLDVSAGEPVVTMRHRVDQAIACDRGTGEVVSRSRPSGRGMTARVVSRDPVVVSLDCATSFPVPGVPAALRELGYRGTITYRLAEWALAIDLMVGLFPATEGYGSVNEGNPAIIFRQASLPGPPARAPGGALRRIRATFVGRDGSGFFPDV
jgi:hypothetical protein